MTALLAFLLLAAPQEKKIVLLAGPLDDHPAETHEYEKNVVLLRHLMMRSDVFRDVRVEIHYDGWPADPRALDDADAIFLASGGSDRRLETHPLYVGDRLEQLRRLMKRGAGVFFFHWSTFHPAKHHDDVTEWAGGYFDYETGPGPRKWYSAIETREWTTSLPTPDHPVVRGVKPFSAKEEFYYRIRFRDEDPRLRLLLACREGPPRENAVAWAVERADGGRGVGFTGGHFFANWWNDDFRRFALNALAWAAKLEVPAGGVDVPLPPRARVLLVTGHDHPAHDWRKTTAAHVHAIEQDPRIRVEVVEDPEELGRRDLSAYAGIVLNYNNWDRPSLSPAARVAFTRRLESGGGLAVVHFSNGAFNPTLPSKEDWDDYRTRIVRRTWTHPVSAHDKFRPFRVEIAPVRHEITDGLAAFETLDELYVRQSGDAPIEPLATARSEITGKDEPLAWAYAVEKGRVFQTLLGHSPVSVRRAGALIRRGVAWSAGLPPLGADPPLDRLEKAVFRRGAPWTPKLPENPQEKPREKGILPADPGLDGGKGGHWGLQGEKDWADARWNAMDTGPFMSSSLSLPGGPVLKGVTVRLGAEAAAVYDTQHLSLRAAWTGGFLRFGPARFGLVEMPRPAGDPSVFLPAVPAWGPSPARHLALRVHGDRVVFESEVDGARVLDAFRRVDGRLVRTLRLAPCPRPRELLLAVGDAVVLGEGVVAENGRRRLVLPASEVERTVAVVYGAGSAPAEDLAPLLEPGPARWGPALALKGVAGRDPGPYVLDTIPLPFDNPWKALLFPGGHDFLTDGRAAVATVHGDVWVVDGLDATLDRVTWKRFATGLFQPLGVKVVGDLIHVQGRDQITRLRDLDGDGEADAYENVSNLRPTLAGGHDYVTCLETDAEGRFYGVGPTTLHRVSADGRTFEILATGLRNANGMALGPDGTIVAAPQEGEWTPATMICEVRRGDHFGFGGPRDGRVDRPLCYIPRLVDNSTGGQVFVTSDRWGPLQGLLLSFSYGRSTMQLVLRDGTEGIPQGAVASFPLIFASGAMRGRFHPRDGQLYVTGMKGWVSNAARDGCFQRVRYVGGPVAMPVGWSTAPGAVSIRFAVPLDRGAATNPDRWALEQWNYRYSSKYGSEDWSIANPEKTGHDPVEPAGVELSDDGREVTLRIPSLAPVHQLRLRYSLRAADKTPVKGELTCTIHRVGPKS